MEGPVNHNITVPQHLLHISLAAAPARAEIALVVRSARDLCHPGLLRMHQHRIVLCLMRIEDRRKYIILHLDEPQRPVHTVRIRSCHDRHGISRKANVTVYNQTIAGTELRIGLSREREARHILGHILPGIDRLYPRNLPRELCMDLPDYRIGVRRAQELHHKAICRCDIFRVHRLSGDQLHRILFPYGTADRLKLSALCIRVAPRLTELLHPRPLSSLTHFALRSASTEEKREFHGAAPHSPNSGRDCPRDTREFLSPTDMDSRGTEPVHS